MNPSEKEPREKSTFSEILNTIPGWMKWSSVILAILTLVPLFVYVIFFWGYPYSDKPGDWGVFGDYVGGTLNPLLAITGIFVTFCLAYIAREAEKASIKRREMEVRPLARIALGDYENVIEVKIENAGLGPLIIKSITVFNEQGDAKKSLIAWFENDKFGFVTWAEYVGDASGFVVSPSNELVLLKLTSNPQKEGDNIYYRDEIRRALSKLILKVEYYDLYGNSLPPQTRTLDWFGRKIYAEKRR